MTKRTKTNLKIAGATALCIFTLTTAFTSTMAWFASNRSVGVTGMNIRVDPGDRALSSMTVHKCLLSQSTKDLLKFDPNPSYTVSGYGNMIEANGLVMEKYSTLNQTQPVLLLFTFSEDSYSESVDITVKSDNDGFVDEVDENNIDNFPFSSVVSFKAATYASGTYNTFPFDGVKVGGDVYDGDDADVLGDSKTFVTFSGGNAIWATNSEISLYTGTANKYVAVVLDYYSAAIETILLNSSILLDGDYVSESGTAIDFYCDWTLRL